jgi:small conductance mechanosensitive channel
VLKGPVDDSDIVVGPWMGLGSLGDSGVVIKTRSWCKGADYWTVYFGLNETIYQTLKEKGYMFPFNRMDVTILNK